MALERRGRRLTLMLEALNDWTAVLDALELVMRQIELPCGIEIDGERLQYLMFADDIVLIGSEPSALESSLNILSEASQSIGLVIHPGKTKWMKNNYTNDYRLCMKGSVIEEVSSSPILAKQ
ncbi:hypothetical protein COOONC_23295 [Cooperia oncophora]